MKKIPCKCLIIIYPSSLFVCLICWQTINSPCGSYISAHFVSGGITYLVSNYLCKDVCTANSFGRQKWFLHQECRQFFLLSSSLLLIQYRISLQCRRPTFHFWVGKVFWGKEWLPIPVLLPWKSHGQRNLVAHSHGAAKSWTWLRLTHTYTHGVKMMSPSRAFGIDLSFLDQGSFPEVKLTVFADIIKAFLH